MEVGLGRVEDVGDAEALQGIRDSRLRLNPKPRYPHIHQIVLRTMETNAYYDIIYREVQQYEWRSL